MYVVPGEKLILVSDASGYGIGGVLSQVVNSTEKVVGYYSRTLSKPERNYCVTRHELLAVLEYIKHYHKHFQSGNISGVHITCPGNNLLTLSISSICIGHHSYPFLCIGSAI